jgi:hypothetical protein
MCLIYSERKHFFLLDQVIEPLHQSFFEGAFAAQPPHQQQQQHQQQQYQQHQQHQNPPEDGYALQSRVDLLNRMHGGCIFAVFVGVSAIMHYGGNAGTQRVATLRVDRSRGDVANAATTRVMYLVLFDAQVNLSDLWLPGDCLLLYRPFCRCVRCF